MPCLDFDGDKTDASNDPVLVVAAKENKLPPLIDIMIVNGKHIEGCPFPVAGTPESIVKAEYDFFGNIYRPEVIIDGKQFNDEFVVRFTDADYNKEFMRKCHELSKVFLLRSLEKNRIGEITDMATKNLAAISRLEWHLANNIDVHSNPLDDDTRKHYIKEIFDMNKNVKFCRFIQGYEIDKPKHGGAFWDAMEKELRFMTNPDFYPEFASETVQYGKFVTRKYSDLEWHKANKTKDALTLQDGRVYPSLMQELRSHVLFSFATKIKAKLALMNPAESSDNLIYTFAPHANANDHGIIEGILKNLGPIFDSYNDSMKEIGHVRNQFDLERSSMDFKNKYEQRAYDRFAKFKVDAMMNSAIETATAKVKSLPFDEMTIAYVAYAKKYNNYRPSKASRAGSGLSFPWVVCRDGMLKLVAAASGKVKNHLKFTDIKPADVKIRFKDFFVHGDKVAELMTTNNVGSVYYHVNEITGNYLPYLYIKKECIGVLPSDYAYYFTGAEKFVFQFDNFELSKSKLSASVRLTNIVRYLD